MATLAQQASARRLTRSGALVRAPRSVEALGRVDVVCFDKTGTLSENRLRVARVEAATGVADADVLDHAGRATPPANGGRHEHATDIAVARPPRRLRIRRAPQRCTCRFGQGGHTPPRSATGSYPSRARPRSCWRRVWTRSRGAAVGAEDGRRRVARDRCRPSCAVRGAGRSAREDPDAFAELCGEGLQFAGLLGIADTPRPEAAGVLEGLADAGIGVRLITGDHPVTATAIAAELGLPVAADQVISGADWDALSRRGQEHAVRNGVVFARMSPEHKVQVVETLERVGQVCAMVGDGANDAAAIRAATVGIGVAGTGSDPARTAADMMLLDGRIGSLLDALDEGRQLWRRVQAAVAVLLGGNAGEVAFAIFGTALTGRSPLNTRQLLLVNMLTDALPAAALAVSRPRSEQSNGRRGPDQAALWRTVTLGTATAGAATGAWALGSVRASPPSLHGRVGRTGRHAAGSDPDRLADPLVVATAVGSLVALGGMISTPVVSQLLGCTPLDPIGWAQALGTAGAATAVAAIAPKILRFGGRESRRSVDDLDDACAQQHRVHLAQWRRQ